MRPSRKPAIPRIIAAVASAWGMMGVALCDEPTGFGASDAVQMRAKAALEKDPALRGLSLWVSVGDGVVLVSGGVPDEATAAKIERVLSKVSGVSVVRVTTWLVPTVDPIKKLVADKLADNTPVMVMADRFEPSMAVNPVIPAAVTGPIPALPDGIGAPPRPEARSADTVVAQRLEETRSQGILQTPVVTGNGSLRLPPGIDVPSAPCGPVAYPTIRATRVPVAPAEISPAEIALALVEIRRGDPRFSGLVAEVRGGMAVISGSAATKADADAFAAEVAKVGGIERVSVGVMQFRSSLASRH